MAGLDRADRILAAAHGFEEVRHVIVADLELHRRDRSAACRASPDRSRRSCVRFTQIQPLVPSSLTPLRWPSGLSATPNGLSSGVVLTTCLTPLAHSQRRLELRRRGVAAGDRLGRAPAPAIVGRAVEADRPAGDVVVMRAPVGDRAAGVVEPPAERLSGVRSLRYSTCGACPSQKSQWKPSGTGTGLNGPSRRPAGTIHRRPASACRCGRCAPARTPAGTACCCAAACRSAARRFSLRTAFTSRLPSSMVSVSGFSA